MDRIGAAQPPNFTFLAMIDGSITSLRRTGIDA